MATKIRYPGSKDWTNTTYWSGGAVPANGDDVRVTKGADGFDTNLNNPTKDYLSLWFDRGYGDQSTKVGTSASPFEADIDRTNTGVFKFAGQCAEFNIKAGSGTGVINQLEWFPLNDNATLKTGAATTALLILQSGRSVIGSAHVVTSMVVEGGSHVLQTHASNTPAIVCTGGTLTVQRDWSSLTVSGKAVVIIELDSAFTGGTITVHGKDARIIWRFGNTGNCVFYAGVMDLSELSLDSTRGTLGMYGAATEIKERGSARLTGGTRTDYGRGPTVMTVAA